jgi:hypothetical protein
VIDEGKLEISRGLRHIGSTHTDPVAQPRGDFE